MSTLYTMGYLAARSEKKLRDLITMGIPVVDTRYNPASKHPEWRKEYLEKVEGLAYYWVGALGNVNYKSKEPNIQIKDMGTGINQLADILSKHGKACLLCACASRSRCHRSVVAEEAVKRLGLKVVHI